MRGERSERLVVLLDGPPRNLDPRFSSDAVSMRVSRLRLRSLVSVDWQGGVYDCDFNQMLDLPLALDGKRRPQLSDLIGRDLEGNPIAVRDHCYGCTAGQGSSCGGALDD